MVQGTSMQLVASSLATFLVLGLIGIATPVADASSHREAPLITGDPKADATDVYAFVSPDRPDTVTLIANYLPFEEPAGGPNFYQFDDNVLYEIKIDNDGDAVEDIVYQFDFETEIQNPNTFLYNTGPITSIWDEDFNIRQTYKLTKLTYRDGRDRPKKEVLGRHLMTPPVNVGPASTPDYEDLQAEAVSWIPGDGQVFAGQSDDPFFVELGGLFDLLTIRELPGNVGGGVDGLKGFNVQSLAIQVPLTEVTKDGEWPSVENGNEVIGVWTTSSRKSIRVLRERRDGSVNERHRGSWVQVSRLGSPLVNEVVIPLGDKDRWNSSKPARDAQFGEYVANPELGVLLNALYGVAVPPQGPFGTEFARDDLIAVFLTGIDGLTQPADVVPSEQLRLNLTIEPTDSPERLGVLAGDTQGFPNGRRLADDVVDIEIQAVAGAVYPLFHPDFTPDPLATLLGDGVDENDAPFRDEFPYLALPWNGFDSVPHAD